MDQSSIQKLLVEHLTWWGLRRFDSDAAYFQWQRETLGKDILADLHRLVVAKQAPGAPPAAETAFYDRSADPRILPVLYSQRYDYYLALAPLLVGAIHQGGAPRRVLDCGCGIGVLTTFLARLFPAASFLGLDRSPASLAVARDKARALALANVSFEQVDLDQTPVAGSYDLILGTQTLLQSEQEPGLPSRSWDTFERRNDAAAQAGFEARTGLGIKLDHLRQAATSDGRLLFFEKARQLARRVPVQRALAARGWHPRAVPLPLRYRIVEEISDDGPFYLLGRTPDPAYPWSEEPEEVGDDPQVYCCSGPSAEAMRERLPERVAGRSGRWEGRDGTRLQAEWGQAAGCLGYLFVGDGVAGGLRGLAVGPLGSGKEVDCRIGRMLSATAPSPDDPGRIAELVAETWPADGAAADPDQAPLYENHGPSAQAVWQGLPAKTIAKEKTWEDERAGLMHVELGEVGSLVYLYQANTFDQRQLVLVERERRRLLEDYWQELTEGRRP